MPSEAKTCKYFAFISYSRKDSKVAAWLQKRLEWFRFPVKLVPEDRRPPNPKYVRPVYRDKTNLEVTDEHYWTNIRRALEESRFLIVLCSPNSARSEPVNMEAKHFLEAHGGDTSRVVPVIVGGNVMGKGEDAALCPALRDLLEPDGKLLTDRNLPTMVSDADLAEQDAWESGFVALSSYLLQLERGAIGDHIRLEARKQTRVLRRWLTAVGALTIIATVSAWLALNAKQEVEQANAINLQNLHEASMADYNVAVQRIEKENKWHEGVAHLARALKWEPTNRFAAARLYSTLSLHAPEQQAWPRQIMHQSHRVVNAQFSPDGSRIMTVCGERETSDFKPKPGYAQVWDATTGEAIGKPLRHEHIVSSARFSSDGSRVLSASFDETARIWDAATGNPIGKPMRHENNVNSAQFSPDNTRIVTASEDNTAQVWDAATGKLICEPLRHDDSVYSAQFSAEGTRIVTASRDKTARVWGAATGKPIGEPLLHEDSVYSAQFSPDGTRIVTASRDKTVRVWEAATGKPIGEPLFHEDSVHSAQFTPDGTRIITACGDLGVLGYAQIWDATTGKPISDPLPHRRSLNSSYQIYDSSALVSADGTRLITTISHSGSDYAQLWNAATGDPIGVPLHHQEEVNSAQFSPDGTSIVTASDDKSARVWDVSTDKLLGEHLRHQHGVETAHFSPDGTRIVTASDDKTARVWDAATRKPIGEPLLHESSVWDAKFSADGTRIVTASADKTARVWDAATGKPIGEPLLHRRRVTHAQFGADGARIVTVCEYSEYEGDAQAWVWDAVTSKPVGGPLRHKRRVTGAQFSSDGARIVTTSEDKTAQVWDTTTGNPIGVPLHHQGEVKSAAFSADGTRIVTASADNTARVWDVATGKPIGEPLRHHGEVNSAQFCFDGSRIATASRDGTARVWDAATGEPVGEPLSHEDSVYSAQFSPDGTRIVTASHDKSARVWDAITCKPIGEPLRHENGVANAEFSPDGNHIITTASLPITLRIAPCAVIWNVKTMINAPVPVPEWLIQRALAIAGLEFDDDGQTKTISAEQRIAILTATPTDSENDPWSKLARWLAQPANERSLTPDSKLTCRQIAEQERDSGTKEGIESALRYDPTVPLAHVLLAKWEENPQRADFLRNYELHRLPEDAILWTQAATSLVEQKDFIRALQAAEKALKLDPQNAEAQKALDAAKQGSAKN